MAVFLCWELCWRICVSTLRRGARRYDYDRQRAQKRTIDEPNALTGKLVFEGAEAYSRRGREDHADVFVFFDPGVFGVAA